MGPNSAAHAARRHVLSRTLTLIIGTTIVMYQITFAAIERHYFRRGTYGYEPLRAEEH
jgi:Zn-dependent protease with chaperone function